MIVIFKPNLPSLSTQLEFNLLFAGQSNSSIYFLMLFYEVMVDLLKTTRDLIKFLILMRAVNLFLYI